MKLKSRTTKYGTKSSMHDITRLKDINEGNFSFAISKSNCVEAPTNIELLAHHSSHCFFEQKALIFQRLCI